MTRPMLFDGVLSSGFIKKYCGFFSKFNWRKQWLKLSSICHFFDMFERLIHHFAFASQSTEFMVHTIAFSLNNWVSSGTNTLENWVLVVFENHVPFLENICAIRYELIYIINWNWASIESRQHGARFTSIPNDLLILTCWRVFLEAEYVVND